MSIARITNLRIVKGLGSRFENLHAHFAEQVKEKEPDTLHYSLCKSKTDSTVYIIYEEYPDEAAMAAHGRTIHFNNEWTKMGMLVKGHPETVVMNVL